MPVVGKQPADIDARAAFFKRIIELLIGSAAFSHLALQYHSNVHVVLTHVYFALSEAYKAEFLKPGKGTDPTKQAAITCAAICAVNPLRPLPGEAVHEEHIYVNQMLAMRGACTIIDHPINRHNFDAQRRIYLQMQRFKFPSVKPILDEAEKNNGDIKSNVSLKLTKEEEATLKGLVTMFIGFKAMA